MSLEELQASASECIVLEERIAAMMEEHRALPPDWAPRLTRWRDVATVYLQGRAVVLDGLLEQREAHPSKKLHIPPMDCPELQFLKIVEANKDLSSLNEGTKISKFVEAVKSGNAVLLELLLTLTDVDASMKSDWAMRYLVRSYNADILFVLLADGRADPSIEEGRLFTHLSRQLFNPLLLDRLLKHPRVNANLLFRTVAKNPGAFTFSAESGKTIEYIGTQPGILLAAEDITLAIAIKSLPLYERATERLLPTPEQIQAAFASNHVPVIHRILQDERIQEDFTPAFVEACERNILGVAELLVNHPRVNPNGGALVAAARLGNIQIVELLLKSDRVDASANNCAALAAAKSTNQKQVVDMLLNLDPFALEALPDYTAPVVPNPADDLEPVAAMGAGDNLFGRIGGLAPNPIRDMVEVPQAGVGAPAYVGRRLDEPIPLRQARPDRPPAGELQIDAPQAPAGIPAEIAQQMNYYMEHPEELIENNHGNPPPNVGRFIPLPENFPAEDQIDAARAPLIHLHIPRDPVTELNRMGEPLPFPYVRDPVGEPAQQQEVQNEPPVIHNEPPIIQNEPPIIQNDLHPINQNITKFSRNYCGIATFVCSVAIFYGVAATFLQDL